MINWKYTIIYSSRQWNFYPWDFDSPSILYRCWYRHIRNYSDKAINLAIL